MSEVINVYCRGARDNGIGVIHALLDKGGRNVHNATGDNDNAIYYIDENSIIHSTLATTELGKLICRFYSEIEAIDIIDKLPKDIHDVYQKRSTDLVQLTSENCKKLQALDKLIAIRDIYNGTYRPDWKLNERKYVIVCVAGELKRDNVVTRNAILAFETAEIRDKFWYAFAEELNIVKDLL